MDGIDGIITIKLISTSHGKNELWLQYTGMVDWTGNISC